MCQRQGFLHWRKLSGMTTMVFEVTKPTGQEALSNSELKEMSQTDARGRCQLSRCRSCPVHSGSPVVTRDRPGPAILSAGRLLSKQLRPPRGAPHCDIWARYPPQGAEAPALRRRALGAHDMWQRLLPQPQN